MEQVVKITNREKEIILLISHAACRKEIAERLKISLHTVDAHLRNLRFKTNTHSITELIIWAFKNKVIRNN
jgi:DNA-binding CsgD family transcriptional regulator